MIVGKENVAAALIVVALSMTVVGREGIARLVPGRLSEARVGQAVRLVAEQNRLAWRPQARQWNCAGVKAPCPRRLVDIPHQIRIDSIAGVIDIGGSVEFQRRRRQRLFGCRRACEKFRFVRQQPRNQQHLMPGQTCARQILDRCRQSVVGVHVKHFGLPQLAQVADAV